MKTLTVTLEFAEDGKTTLVEIDARGEVTTREGTLAAGDVKLIVKMLDLLRAFGKRRKDEKVS